MSGLMSALALKVRSVDGGTTALIVLQPELSNKKLTNTI
jgi:hypothetical protein